MNRRRLHGRKNDTFGSDRLPSAVLNLHTAVWRPLQTGRERRPMQVVVDATLLHTGVAYEPDNTAPRIPWHTERMAIVSGQELNREVH